jgi:asparagine synthase (glutamine-hydrolysing)
MCGVTAFYAYHEASPAPCDEALERVDAAMAQRGPDGRGAWRSSCGRVAMRHRRLAILDPGPAGHQPMRDEDADLCLSFNGEIYNHQALRESLARDGHCFRGRCDAEVLLAVYRHRGLPGLSDLRGMFAFALWDGRRRELLLVRDPFGIKPLYYSDDGWCVRVASQARALCNDARVDTRADSAGWAGFFVFGSVPEPLTVFRGIRAVPAGSVVRVSALGAQPAQRWHTPEAVPCTQTGSSGEVLAAELAAGLRDSVRAHLVSDVPVGLFLSAGVDSATLLALCAELGATGTRTLTLGFGEFRRSPRDEVPLAGAMARRYGFRHSVREVLREEFEGDLPCILAAMDQPSIDGVNTWFISKAAREQGLKVALSGVGADELLGGYPGFMQIPRLRRALRPLAWLPGARSAASLALRPLVAALGLHPKWAGLARFGGSLPGAYLLRRGLFLPAELPRVMGREAAAEGLARLQPEAHLRARVPAPPAGEFWQIASLEASLYLRNQLLRDCDWAGMAHGVEIRVPFVDADLTRRLTPLLCGMQRPPGKELLARAPRHPLPRSVVERRKTGFETPLSQWLSPAQGERARGRCWALHVGASLGAPLAVEP